LIASNSPRTTPLIIACGNPDRADDGAGILVAERLRQIGIAVKVCLGDAPDLIETWSVADDVIVIDCIVTGADAGTVSVWDASRPLPSQSSASSHGLGLGEAMELSRALGCLPPRLRVYGIEGKNFEVGASLSPEVEFGVAEVVEKIVAEVESRE